MQVRKSARMNFSWRRGQMSDAELRSSRSTFSSCMISFFAKSFLKLSNFISNQREGRRERERERERESIIISMCTCDTGRDMLPAG